MRKPVLLLVVGVNDSKKLLEDIPNKIVNNMGLVVDVNLYEQNGLDYIELIVNPSNVPISFKGKYYYRSLYGKHSSRPRNRNIADTMFKAGFIDTWGRGYKKIHDGFVEVGLPMPTVKSHCGGTLVTFQRGYDVVSGRKNVSSLLAETESQV